MNVVSKRSSLHHGCTRLFTVSKTELRTEASVEQILWNHTAFQPSEPVLHDVIFLTTYLAKFNSVNF